MNTLLTLPAFSPEVARCPAAPHTRPARILYVDDEPQLRKLGKMFLSRLGYDVVTAEDGTEAWSQLKEAHYNLLVTDHNMPGLTGLELIMLVRRAGMRLPAILVSGTLKPREELDSSGAELAEFLAKPFTFGGLAQFVEQMLHKANSSGASTDVTKSAAFHRCSGAEPYPHGGINE